MSTVLFLLPMSDIGSKNRHQDKLLVSTNCMANKSDTKNVTEYKYIIQTEQITWSNTDTNTRPTVHFVVVVVF